jgi:hypothetical protein
MNHRGAQIRAWLLTAALGAQSLVAASISASDEPASQTDSPVARCEIAVVNPVSGYAECVKPRGVPVDPPPARPTPTPEECRRHADLHLATCSVDGSRAPSDR